MTDALIGHTGFVGGNLARQRHFDEFYNSRNIEDIRGREFDLVICAGAPGTKWIANERPEEDWAKIGRLMQVVPFIKARRFVLISTIDAALYKDAYGCHRATLEQIVRTYQPRSTIIRLPALFGPGLRKNALFDLMHGQRLDEIAPNATYQWYALRHLAADIEHAAGMSMVNLVSAPITMAGIVAEFFPGAKIGPPKDDAPHYDVQPAFVNGSTVEISKQVIFEEMRLFLAEERAHA